jgi:cytochrome c oxidase subunit 2
MPVPLLLAAGASPQDVSMFDPVSPPAASIRAMFLLVLAITAGIFVIVEGVLLYSIFRFRRNPAPGVEPPQVYGSMPIEIAWTAAPALIVFVLLLVIIRTELEVRAPPPPPQPGDNALYVTVIGHQWWWEYVYEHYDGQKLGVITANELHVPAGDPGETGTRRPVYLTLQSADVCHSFWVPRLAGKTDLIPGRTNQMWFRTQERGLYLGQCAEFCGSQHANMLLRVYVDSPEEFQAWLDNQKKDARNVSSKGRVAFLGQTCRDCHRVRGTPANGAGAPDLTHLMSRQTLGSGMIPNNRDELKRWVSDPKKVKPECLMAGFGGLPDFNDVIDYLASLE